MRQPIYISDVALQKMFKMSKALALLPIDSIAGGFCAIKSQGELSQNQDIVQRYLDYFKTQWIQRVGPENFSVYGSARRTNNDQEVFHKLLNAQMNGPRPGIWHFTKRTNQQIGPNADIPPPAVINVDFPPAVIRPNTQVLAPPAVIQVQPTPAVINDPLPTEQQNHIVDNNNDFIIPEEADELFVFIGQMEMARTIREREDVPYVLADAHELIPRSINSCAIFLAANNTHACTPCGHKCMCVDCSVEISQSKLHMNNAC
ncbi:uncharacterized protein LOC126842335 [Adelges cooleyi]|uniref:uncharacterized protein LOC126842335 n=1 Tax=Adelges cooleyi TaxID=133065 RepID=UPI002180172D|nr:uncharacterized protein LOC126842335 [Adelges cooleyi]